MAEGTRIWLFTMLVVLQAVTLSAQNPCESPVFTNGIVFEALMENSPENTTIVANMSFAGTAVGPGQTIELTLQDSSDKDWGLLVEELQQLRLRLAGKVLDRDGNTGIRDLRFVIRCKTIATNATVDNSIIATVLDLNDNSPTFIGEPYNQDVLELTPVGSTIFRRVTTDDLDSNENGRVSYQIEGQSEYFEIPLPSEGDIVLKKSLDYEGFQPGEEKKYLIPIVAHDLAANLSLRKSSTTTVTIIVTDGDDQAVQFLPCIPQGDICGSPLYVSSVMENTEPLNQPLTFDPAPVFAIDLDIDVQGPPGIVYSFLAGSPSDFRDYFDINAVTGNITLKRPVERTQVEKFIITIKAEQDDNLLRYATADVKIGVEDDDFNNLHIAGMASLGAVAALLLIGLVAAVTYIVVSKRKDGTPRASKTAEDRRNPGTRSVPTFDNQAFDEVGNGNITIQCQTISADTDSDYAVPVVERNGHMEEGAYQPLDPKTRINSDYQKLERGTITRDSTFDDTYYTDTITNHLSDNGSYLEVIG